MARLPLSASILLLAIGAAAAADPLPVHYWAGQTRIDTAVGLDRVAAVGKAHERTLTAVADAVDLAALGRVKPVGAATTFAVLRGGTAQNPLLLTRTLVVGLHAGTDAQVLAGAHGCQVIGAVEGLPGVVVLAPKGGDLLAALSAANAIQESGAARFATPLIERQHSKRGDPPDPQFANQWHLKNSGAQVPGAVAGNDINVSPLWNFGSGANLGTGINVAVVDDGMERTHEDLTANARLDLGLNFNGTPGGTTDPSPGSSDFHGTWCSGLIAARDSNTFGGVGVAPRASLIGVRLIAAATTEAEDASALTYQSSETDSTKYVHVSSNSWGPADDVVSDPTLANAVLGATRAAALQTGTSNGRGGKGTVYVWAAGNGRSDGDNLSYDGLASSRYVIAVGASTATGAQASYSESGPALLVNAGGGSGAGGGIVTTDRTGAVSEAGNYTTLAEGISGTSFSTPVVAGVVALMLEANPLLTWRDVKHVLVRTSTKNDSGDSLWLTNGDGRQHNVRHGFGRVNAAAAVAAAAPATWIGVPVAATPLTKSESVAVAIPDNNTAGVSRTLSFASGTDVPTGFRAEYVELTVSATHTYRGDLRFRLTAPSGMVSDFARRPPDSGDNLSNWIFTSAAHWGENPTGNWTLTVSDDAAADTGALTAWSLSIHGYLPHPTATISSFSPQVVATGSGNTVVIITGSGFVAGVTRATSGATSLAATVVSPNRIDVTVPMSLLASHGGVPISVVTPSFDGPAATPVTVTLQAGSLPQFTVVPGAQSINEDTPTGALTVTIADGDGDPLTLSASSGDTTRISNSGLVLGGSGGNRTITVTPVPEVSGGPTTITLTLSDGISTVTTTFTVTINAVNDPPVAFDGTFEVSANQAVSGFLTGFDPDVGQTLTATIDAGPSSGTLTNFVASTGAFTYTPTPGFTGLDSFTWHLTDNFSSPASSTTARATLVVLADPGLPRPRITSEPSVEVVMQGGGTWTYTPTVSHTSATTLQVSAPASVVGGTQISWPITAPASGNHISFVIIARDALTGALDYQQIILRYVPTGAPN